MSREQNNRLHTAHVNPHCMSFEIMMLVNAEPKGRNYMVVFTQSRNKQWKCNICAKAVRHEDTAIHVSRVRQIDQRIPDPLLIPEQTQQSRFGSKLSDISFPEDSTPPSSPQRQPKSMSPPQKPHADQGDLLLGVRSIHGPALPEDNEYQIYDDWGGELAYNRPESDADRDLEDDTFRSNVSDSTDEDSPTQGPITSSHFGDVRDDFEQREKPSADLLMRQDDALTDQQRRELFCPYLS